MFWEEDERRRSRINDGAAYGGDEESLPVPWTGRSRLLNLRSMHVLLVEKDEITRSFVVLLLRECGGDGFVTPPLHVRQSLEFKIKRISLNFLKIQKQSEENSL